MKSLINKPKNSLIEIPFETELKFKTGLTRALLSGTKRVTIRLGKRKFTQNINIHGKQAVVHWYKHTTLLHIDFDVLRLQGFKTMFEAMVRLKEHYPAIDINTPITVVEFRIVV